MKKTFIFYKDWIDYTEQMTMEEKGLFLQTILDYQNGTPPQELGSIKFIWGRVKNQLDEDNAKRENELELRRKAGKLGGQATQSKIKHNQAHAGKKQARAQKIKQLQADNVNVNDNVNDIGVIYKEDILLKEEYDEVTEFINIQKSNIAGVNYKVEEEGDKYYKRQYEEYTKLLKEAKSKNLTREHVKAILKFIPEDPFWRTNIGSIIKLRTKNKDGVPYRVVMIGKIQKDMQSQKQVFNY